MGGMQTFHFYFFQVIQTLDPKYGLHSGLKFFDKWNNNQADESMDKCTSLSSNKIRKCGCNLTLLLGVHVTLMVNTFVWIYELGFGFAQFKRSQLG